MWSTYSACFYIYRSREGHSEASEQVCSVRTTLLQTKDSILHYCGHILLAELRQLVLLLLSYISEFHPRMIGLTGTTEQVKQAAKAYRVYYVKAEEYQGDYLVDHSIIMVRLLACCLLPPLSNMYINFVACFQYLVNPLGDFVTFYGKNSDAGTIAESIMGHIHDWAKKNDEYSRDHPNYKPSSKAQA